MGGLRAVSLFISRRFLRSSQISKWITSTLHDKFMEKHELWAAVRMSAQTKRHKEKQMNACSLVTRLQLMAYSDGTLGRGPNICTHDLSCFPQGPSVEKYSDTIVSACVCVRVCVYMELLSCYFTSSYSHPHTHTPNHQRAKRNNGAREVKSLQVSPPAPCLFVSILLTLPHLNSVSLSLPTLFSAALSACKCWANFEQIF